MAADGTRGRSLDPERRKLFDEGKSIVEQCAREIGKRYHVSPREVLGAGTIALHDVARTYDRDQHPSFVVYARHHLLGRMIDALHEEPSSRADRIERVMERAFEGVMAHHVVPVDLMRDSEEEILDGSRGTQAEILAGAYLAGLLDAQKEDPAEGIIERLWLRDGVARLFKYERQVLHMVYWEQRSLDEVAEALGIHKNTAQRRHASALRKLHQFLVEERAKLK